MSFSPWSWSRIAIKIWVIDVLRFNLHAKSSKSVKRFSSKWLRKKVDIIFQRSFVSQSKILHFNTQTHTKRVPPILGIGVRSISTRAHKQSNLTREEGLDQALTLQAKYRFFVEGELLVPRKRSASPIAMIICYWSLFSGLTINNMRLPEITTLKTWFIVALRTHDAGLRKAQSQRNLCLNRLDKDVKINLACIYWCHCRFRPSWSGEGQGKQQIQCARPLPKLFHSTSEIYMTAWDDFTSMNLRFHQI